MSSGSKSPYGYYGVYGSLAYDFRPVGNERAGDYSRVDKSPPKKKVRRARRTSPALITGSALCAVLLLCGLMAQSALVELSDKAVAAQQEIEGLLQEQTRLKIEHSMAFQPEETERYAIEELGMRKPTAEQICYIDTMPPMSEADIENTELSWSLWNMIREYLPG